MGKRVQLDELMIDILINNATPKDSPDMLTEITFVEGMLRLRRERFETVEPGVGSSFDFLVVWVDYARPRPIGHSFWKVKHFDLGVVEVAHVEISLEGRCYAVDTRSYSEFLRSRPLVS